MRLSWNEIRARAAEFAREWASARYEKGETQSFYNDFFEVFGIKRRSVARYEEHVRKLDNSAGFIDLFWPGVVLVEQKSAGRDLLEAYGQAGGYFDALPEHQRPRYILVSDFQTFALTDLDTRENVSFSLADLAQHVDKFGFMLGVQKRTFKDQDPVNIRAAELVGALHDTLADSGFVGHDLERFLVRIVFCLFADDTGVFERRNMFLDWLNERTAEDGSDLGGKLTHLFQVLDTPEDRRSTNLDEDLAAFPYVNGELFDGSTRIPSFDAAMRQALIRACEFNWEPISPAIFGSLFQSVMNRQERRKLGAHYTTEKNILKVIGPLFLDGLWEEFHAAQARKRGRTQILEALHARLGKMAFLDPACGCGNFLIIAYRELRRLEIAILKAIHGEGAQMQLDAASLSRIDVDQFYGIEISEFPAEIARAAMWMMDHIMNNELSLTFGQNYARIPLRKAPHIHHADALAIDWADVIAPDRCSFILGNPPFVGAKYQSPKERAQVRDIARLGGSGGTLDFVAAWFIKAGEYVRRIERAIGIGFVSTNSITQGEQVAQLWPILFERYGLEIAFAHRTFAWTSEARGKAAVHVVVIGLAKRDFEPVTKRLFSYDDIKGEPVESAHVALGGYLIDASGLADRHLVVPEAARPINGMPKLIIGSKPIDGGHMIFTRVERDAFASAYPDHAKYVRPYVGAHEYLNGGDRWIIAVQDAAPEVVRAAPPLAERLAAVRRYRRGEIPARGKGPETIKAPGMSSLALAETPAAFHVTVVPKAPFLVLPKVSSERREYVPIGWLQPPTVPSDLLFVLSEAELWHFAVLTSAAHMAWLRHVGGRLESRYRYSIGLVYNTFPWPNVDDAAKAKLTAAGQAILDARAAHPGATLADLYDPDSMPADLRAAHRANDRLVDSLYLKDAKGKTRFESERERVEHLFMLYEQRLAPLTLNSPNAGAMRRRTET